MREEGVTLKNRCHACGEPKRGHTCYAKFGDTKQVDLTASQGSLEDEPLMPGLNDSSGVDPPPMGYAPILRGYSIDVDGFQSCDFDGLCDVPQSCVPPPLKRGNTSFFRDLAKSECGFSPDLRECLEAWSS